MPAISRLFAVCAVLLLAGRANAATFNYSSYSLLNPVEVGINDRSLGVAERAYAGQITLNGANISSFCFDIADALLGSGTFTLSGTVGGSLGGVVNALLSHVQPTLSTNASASAALQVAVWNAEYGTGRSGVTISGPQSVLDLASYYATQVSSGAWQADPTQQVNLLTQSGNQSQVYLARVSEPGTVGVLAIGAIGALYRRYCRAKAGSASSPDAV